MDLFGPETPEWGVSETAAQLNVAKSSAHELLSTLAEIGLLRRVPHGRYRLGWRIASLNHALIESSGFRERAGTYMQNLAERFQKTLHLAVLVDHEIVYLGKYSGPRSAPIPESAVGASMDAHCTGVGKVLLAFADGVTAEEVAARHGLQRRTRHTITSVPALRAELDAIRTRGFAFDLEEAVSDLCCAAAPIRDRHGAVHAALSISVPNSQFRLNPERYQQIAGAAADEISRELRSMSSAAISPT